MTNDVVHPPPSAVVIFLPRSSASVRPLPRKLFRLCPGGNDLGTVNGGEMDGPVLFSRDWEDNEETNGLDEDEDQGGCVCIGRNGPGQKALYAHFMGSPNPPMGFWANFQGKIIKFRGNQPPLRSRILAGEGVKWPRAGLKL